MKIHLTKSELAGKVVRIKPGARHHLYSDFGGADILIIDWFDRVAGKRIDQCHYGPIYGIVYSARWARYLAGYLHPSQANEILVGSIKGCLHVVHISELEIPEPGPAVPMAA